MQFSKNRSNQVTHWNRYFGQDSPSEDQIKPFLRKVPPFRVRLRDIEERNKRQKPKNQKSFIHSHLAKLRAFGKPGPAVHPELFYGSDPSTGCGTTRRSFTAGAGAPFSHLSKKQSSQGDLEGTHHEGQGSFAK